MDIPASSVHRWRTAAMLCASIVTAIGAMMFMGWMDGSNVPGIWHIDFPATFLNAGFLFILTGAALIILIRNPPWASLAVQIVGAVVLVLAGVRLLDYFFQDTLLADGDGLDKVAADPGLYLSRRLGLPGAVNFLIANASLLLLSMSSNRRSTDAAAGIFGSIVGFMGLIHLLGHLYGRPLHYGAGVASMPMIASVGFLALGTGQLLTVFLRELTVRLGERRRQSALYVATRALVESASLNEAADKMLAALCGTLGWRHGAVWVRNDKGRANLRCVGAWSAPGPSALRKLHTLSRTGGFARGVGLPGRAWMMQDLVWIADPNEDSQFARTAAAHNAGLFGGFAVPIFSGQDVLGVLEVLVPKPQPPTDDDRTFWQGVASQMALYLKRKHAEQALSDEHNRLRSVIDNLPDHIYLKDTEGHYVLDNLAHQRFLGLGSDSEIIGKTVYNLFPPEIAARYEADDKVVLQTGKSILNREEPHVDPDGEMRWAATSKLPFRDETGKLIGLICVTRDITSRKLAENALQEIQLQLIQAEKLESLGRLAAGIAHEVKNPLALIMMGADYLAGDLAESEREGDSAALEVIGQIREATMRADMIIRGMLDLSAPSALELKPTNLDELLDKTLPLVRHEMDSANVALRTQLAGDLPLALLDANKIQQVFINLCTNAVHAMPEGGTLTVQTAVRVLGTGEARARNEGERVNERMRAGDTVIEVLIDDSGTGIPPDKLAYIFEPFYTTKTTGKGTGLGLSVTKKIIELHRGEIRLSNRPEGGARVAIFFRAAPSPALDGVEENETCGVAALASRA